MKRSIIIGRVKHSFLGALIVMFFIFLFSNNAVAECLEENCRTVKVTRLYLADHVGKVFIETSGDETQLSCSPFEGKFIILDPSQTFYKEIYATLLAAMLSEKNITIKTHVKTFYNSDYCHLGYMQIHSQ